LPGMQAWTAKDRLLYRHGLDAGVLSKHPAAAAPAARATSLTSVRGWSHRQRASPVVRVVVVAGRLRPAPAGEGVGDRQCEQRDRGRESDELEFQAGGHVGLLCSARRRPGWSLSCCHQPTRGERASTDPQGVDPRHLQGCSVRQPCGQRPCGSGTAAAGGRLVTVPSGRGKPHRM